MVWLLKKTIPRLVTQKNPPLNRPSKDKPLGGVVLGNYHQIQSKTKKNGKFPTKNKANPIDF